MATINKRGLREKGAGGQGTRNEMHRLASDPWPSRLLFMAITCSAAISDFKVQRRGILCVPQSRKVPDVGERESVYHGMLLSWVGVSGRKQDLDFTDLFLALSQDGGTSQC